MIISSSQGGTATVRNIRTGETGSSVSGTIDDTFMFIGVPSNGYHKTYVKLKGDDNEIAYDSNYVVNAGGTYEYTGYFALNTYTVSVSIESGEYQSYYQGGTYAYGTALEMWVQIDPHYVFHYWEDTNGNRVYPEDQGNNRLVGKITVTGDVSYKLVASPRVYNVYFVSDTTETYDSTIATRPSVYATVSSGNTFKLPSNGHVTKPAETLGSYSIEFKPANGDSSTYKNYDNVKSFTQNGWAYENTSTTVAAGASVIIEEDTNFMAWWSSRT